MPYMFKAIIFDLDDTLIDFRERKKVLIKRSVEAMIKAGLEEDPIGLYDEFNKFYWDTGIEDQNIFEKFLAKKYGHVDYRVLAHAIIAYRRANALLLKPYPNVVEVLGKLKKNGIKLAILSDAPKLAAYTRLVEVGMDELFDVIITFDDVLEIKPSIKGFKMVIEQLDVKKEECLMVGDNPDRDVIGAKKFGMKICLARYERELKADVDYSINDVKELLDIVKDN
jgi:putative hydrolase of the HAD superfamily